MTQFFHPVDAVVFECSEHHGPVLSLHTEGGHVVLQHRYMNVVFIQPHRCKDYKGRHAHHGTGLCIRRESEDADQLGQSHHLQLPVPQRLVVSPDPSAMITSCSTSWKIQDRHRQVCQLQLQPLNRELQLTYPHPIKVFTSDLIPCREHILLRGQKGCRRQHEC